MQVEAYLKNDDRAIVPLGSTEQHAYLSLSVDSILAEKMALDSAEPLAVPVFPVVAYGVTPYFMAYPGTITMRIETYLRVIRDILDSLKQTGFRRILFVNGHGGNSPANSFATEWMAENPGVQVKFHDRRRVPQTWGVGQGNRQRSEPCIVDGKFSVDVVAGVVMPDSHKVLAAETGKATQVGEALRAYLGDGNFGGWYQRSDAEMLEILADCGWRDAGVD